MTKESPIEFTYDDGEWLVWTEDELLCIGSGATKREALNEAHKELSDYLAEVSRLLRDATIT